MTNYFLPQDPPSGEQSNYDRFLRAWAFPTTFNWLWRFDSSFFPANGQARSVVYQYEGNPPVVIGPWVAGVSSAYNLAHSLPLGYYVEVPETNQAGAVVFAKSFVVNGGTIPGPKTPWVYTNRYDIEHGFAATISPRQVTYDQSWRPYIARRKDRTITPYSTLLPNNQLWASSPLRHARNMFDRRVYLDEWDNAVVVPEQRYTYHEAIARNVGLPAEYIPGKQPPVQFTSRDGDKRWGTLGYVSKVWIRRGLKHVFIYETSGRFCIVSRKPVVLPVGVADPGFIRNTEGAVSTLWGWYVPANIPRRGKMGVNTNGEKAWIYQSGYEYAGDTSRLPAGFVVQEGWGFITLAQLADGSITDRDCTDALISSTLNHCVVHLELAPPHPDVSAQIGRQWQSAFLPPGQTPSLQRGPAIGRLWGGCVPGVSSSLFNQPWDFAFTPQDNKVYWTNMAGHNVCRANPNGSSPEVFIPSAQFTAAQIGVDVSPASPGRLFPSTLNIDNIRALLVEGPRASARIVCPQGIVRDAAGNLYIGCRYAYAIMKWTRATDMVSIFCLIPKSALQTDANGRIASSSSSVQDVMIGCDVFGENGPAGDITLAMWGSGWQYRIAADGTWRGNAFSNHGTVPFRAGPWDRVDPPSYTMAPPDVYAGLTVIAGNDSGDQYTEISKKLALDPVAPNETAYLAGQATWNKYFMLTHGAFGYGELGHPNADHLGSMDNATLTSYLLGQGVPSAELANLITYIRWLAVENDYTTAPPPDTTAPGMPGVFNISVTYQGAPVNSYSLQVSGSVPANDGTPLTDIAKANLYIDSIKVASIAVANGAGYSFPAQDIQEDQRPADGNVLVEVQYEDGATPPNAGPKRAQVAFLADKQAPGVPGPFTVVVTYVQQG